MRARVQSWLVNSDVAQSVLLSTSISPSRWVNNGALRFNVCERIYSDFCSAFLCVTSVGREEIDVRYCNSHGYLGKVQVTSEHIPHNHRVSPRHNTASRSNRVEPPFLVTPVSLLTLCITSQA